VACTKEKKEGRWTDGTAIVDKLRDKFHWVLDIDVVGCSDIVYGIGRSYLCPTAPQPTQQPYDDDDDDDMEEGMASGTRRRGGSKSVKRRGSAKRGDSKRVKTEKKEEA
jgi:hypothetical protein